MLSGVDNWAAQDWRFCAIRLSGITLIVCRIFATPFVGYSPKAISSMKIATNALSTADARRRLSDIRKTVIGRDSGFARDIQERRPNVGVLQ
jgi:hypothetical protein